MIPFLGLRDPEEWRGEDYGGVTEVSTVVSVPTLVLLSRFSRHLFTSCPSVSSLSFGTVYTSLPSSGFVLSPLRFGDTLKGKILLSGCLRKPKRLIRLDQEDL